MILRKSQFAVLKLAVAILEDLHEDKKDGGNRVGPYTITLVKQQLNEVIVFMEQEQKNAKPSGRQRAESDPTAANR